MAEENADLKQQLAIYKKALFGQKSEKTVTVIGSGVQLSFFDEAESEADISVKNADKSITVAEHKRKSKRTHEEILADLPCEEVIHPVKDKSCPECGTDMVTVGKEFVSDELVYTPPKLVRRKHMSR